MIQADAGFDGSFPVAPRFTEAAGFRMLGQLGFNILSALLRAAAIKRLSGVGHYRLEDAPEAVAAPVSNFIRPS